MPIAIQRRRRKLKPSLTVICDVSTSMRPVAEFMLRLIYELADQVVHARSFAFNADLEEIRPAMAGRKAADAVAEVLYAIRIFSGSLTGLLSATDGDLPTITAQEGGENSKASPGCGCRVVASDWRSYTGMRRTESALVRSSESATWTEAMIGPNPTTPSFAVCVDNRKYPASLELHKVYRLVPDPDAEQDGDLRVIDESGEDYLFPATCFVLVAPPVDQVAALQASYNASAA